MYLVLFADGDQSWLLYSPDIYETAAFASFVSTRPELYILTVPTKSAASWIAALNKVAIDQLHVYDPAGKRPHRPWMTHMQPGVTVYIDLRYWSDDGHNWYFSLDLPQINTHVYVVMVTFSSWANSKHTSIYFSCPLFDTSGDCMSTYDVFAYGSRTVFNPDSMLLVDATLAVAHPEILPKASRARLLRRYKSSLRQEEKEEGRKGGVV